MEFARKCADYALHHSNNAMDIEDIDSHSKPESKNATDDDEQTGVATDEEHSVSWKTINRTYHRRRKSSIDSALFTTEEAHMPAPKQSAYFVSHGYLVIKAEVWKMIRLEPMPEYTNAYKLCVCHADIGNCEFSIYTPFPDDVKIWIDASEPTKSRCLDDSLVNIAAFGKDACFKFKLPKKCFGPNERFVNAWVHLNLLIHGQIMHSKRCIEIVNIY